MRYIFCYKGTEQWIYTQHIEQDVNKSDLFVEVVCVWFGMFNNS